jgi:hypothetical protein
VPAWPAGDSGRCHVEPRELGSSWARLSDRAAPGHPHPQGETRGRRSCSGRAALLGGAPTSNGERTAASPWVPHAVFTAVLRRSRSLGRPNLRARRARRRWLVPAPSGVRQVEGARPVLGRAGAPDNGPPAEGVATRRANGDPIPQDPLGRAPLRYRNARPRQNDTGTGIRTADEGCVETPPRSLPGAAAVSALRSTGQQPPGRRGRRKTPLASLPRRHFESAPAAVSVGEQTAVADRRTVPSHYWGFFAR